MSKREYVSYDGKGVDVASQRADDLDKLVLAKIYSKTTASILELGAGSGGQAFRMVEAGASVMAVDEHDFSPQYETYKIENQLSSEQLVFTQQTFSEFFSQGAAEQYESALWQRSLHYVPFKDALSFLTQLRTLVSGKLFISVTGLESAVGEGYAGTSLPIEERYCGLSPNASTTFSITEPVCLYTRSEFEEVLKASGWKAEKVWTSAFGNHKAVCTKE